MSDAVDHRPTLRKLIHDVRTPLTVIGGFADLLVRQGDTMDEAARRDALERVLQASEELRQLVDEADDASS